MVEFNDMGTSISWRIPRLLQYILHQGDTDHTIDSPFELR